MVELAYLEDDNEDDNEDDKTLQVQPLATARRPTTSVYSNDDYDQMEGILFYKYNNKFCFIFKRTIS